MVSSDEYIYFIVIGVFVAISILFWFIYRKNKQRMLGMGGNEGAATAVVVVTENNDDNNNNNNDGLGTGSDGGQVYNDYTNDPYYHPTHNDTSAAPSTAVVYGEPQQYNTNYSTSSSPYGRGTYMSTDGGGGIYGGGTTTTTATNNYAYPPPPNHGGGVYGSKQ